MPALRRWLHASHTAFPRPYAYGAFCVLKMAAASQSLTYRLFF